MRLDALKIKRNINGTDIEIELTWAEMWEAKVIAELQSCAEAIQDQFETEIPRNELLGYAQTMKDYMDYNNFGYYEARDAVCEENDLYDECE